jgi:hypothetical protein
MNKFTFVFLLCGAYFISGCTTVNVPIDSTPLSTDKSTLIIYSYRKEGRCGSNCVNSPLSGNILIDGSLVGQVNPKQPLKTAVSPGKHDIYIETEDKINGVSTLEFHAGKVYFLRTWVEIVIGSMFNNFFNLKIEKTEKISSYEF